MATPWFPEGTTPAVGDNPFRSWQKIVGLGTAGSGSIPGILTADGDYRVTDDGTIRVTDDGNIRVVDV